MPRGNGTRDCPSLSTRYGFWECGKCGYSKNISNVKDIKVIERTLKMCVRLHGRTCEGAYWDCDYAYTDDSRAGGMSHADRTAQSRRTAIQTAQDHTQANNPIAESYFREHCDIGVGLTVPRQKVEQEKKE